MKAMALVLLTLIGASAHSSFSPAHTSERNALESLRPESALRLTATAYCLAGRTRSGSRTRPGTVAADLRLFPLGTVLRVDEPRAHAGIYTVMDTGPRVRGRTLDIFMSDCGRAKRFGRQPVLVRVLRRG